jgi:WASH complex subunit 7
VYRLATSGAKGVNALLRKFIVSPPLIICHMRIYVKDEVENYLEKSFYDLSTLNLNDCNTYTRMRIIATERYGLHLTDPFLPDGSLDHGVDFIDILRDLNREYVILNDIPNRLEC